MSKYIPTKHDDPEVKKQSIAVKYRKEQELTAQEAIKNCPTKACAVELYAGTGGLTSIYKNEFKKVVTNDLNKNVDTMFHLKASDFIEVVLPSINKIDLIDFDCYGSPALEIQTYFKVRGKKDAPFVLRFSDGFGLFLKRNKNEDAIRKRYLVEGYLPMERVWDRHAELIDYLLHKLAGQNGMRAIKLTSVVTKHKNYVLGTYLFQ